MSREILFKGKRINNKECVEGNLILCTEGKAFIAEKDYRLTYCDECSVPFDTDRMFEVDLDTVCQYICMTDTSDKKNKIFENDICILKFNDGFELTGKIVYSETKLAFEFIFKSRGIHGDIYEHKKKMESYFNLRVVGNTFDNSELLDNIPSYSSAGKYLERIW